MLKKKSKLSFQDNIWGADLADMQLIGKFNKEIRLLLYVIEIYSKYVWLIIPLKDKNGCTITIAVQKILNKSESKLNKIWIYRNIEFYNKFMKSWLKDNGIEMHSAYNEGKSVVAKRFIRALKTKLYK